MLVDAGWVDALLRNASAPSFVILEVLFPGERGVESGDLLSGVRTLFLGSAG